MTMFKALIAAAVVSITAGAANAGHLGFTNFSGNDCTGANAPSGGTTGFTTGKGLFGCAYDGSPVIARFEFGDDFTMTGSSINPAFSSITGGEFTFAKVGNLDDGTGKKTSGYSFTYTAGAGDPNITAFAAKGGNGFNLYDGYDGNATFTMATFLTPLTSNGKNRTGLSHITFFDTATPPISPVPLPAGGLLLMSAIGLVGYMRRRKAA